MNNEIKRIIEELKNNIPIEEYRSEGTSDGLTHYEEDKDSWQYKLLDYIINLQESEAYYYGQYKDYKSRNKKAVEKLKKIQQNAIKYGAEHDVVVCQELIDGLNGKEI